MPVDFSALGCQIRTYRTSNKMTQADLAEKAGLTTHYIGNIEQGVRKPSLDALWKISDALNVHMSDLLSVCVTYPSPECDDNSPNILREQHYSAHTFSDLLLEFIRCMNEGPENDTASADPLARIRFMKIDEAFEHDPNVPYLNK